MKGKVSVKSGHKVGVVSRQGGLSSNGKCNILCIRPKQSNTNHAAASQPVALVGLPEHLPEFQCRTVGCGNLMKHFDTVITIVCWLVS